VTVHIIQTNWADHGAELLAVRRRVFVEEQGVPVELEHDAQDARALHLLALAETGAAVGTARMLDDGHIGRMAVLPEWRGRGIGSRMLRTLVTLAADSARQRPFLHAQCSAIGFYARLGFQAEGPVFVDAGIDHRLMRVTIVGAKD
jgi:predicted GNAT family N-acyltransferase